MINVHQTITSAKQDLVKDLRLRYDYILKIDAIRYLKELHNPSIKECIEAWEMAYKD